MTLAILVYTGLGTHFGSAAEPENIKLVKDGKSPYTIIIPAAPTPQEKFAGNELSKYLRQISGAEIPVKDTGAGSKIFVGVTRDGQGPAGISFTKEESEYDAFVIKTDGQDLYLTGSNKRAVIYAVYTLLEKYLGCRWAGFGDRVQTEEQKKSGGFTEQVEEYIPASKNISLPTINDRQKASFKYRGFISYGWYGNTPRNNVDWATKNKLNYFLIPFDQYEEANAWREDIVKKEMIKRGAVIVVGHHSFYHFLNPAKYFKDHPDWFAMVGGKRVPGGRTTGQFCLSNPDAVKTFRENFIAIAKKYPEVDIFGPGPNDGYGWCECELCTKDKIAWAERPDKNQQAVQDLYTVFAGQLNEDIQKLYPGQGKRVIILAYINYAQPPMKAKPPAGAFISYAFFTRNWFTVPWGNAKGEVAPGPYAFQLNTDNIKQWIELTKPGGGDVTIYEYYCGRSAWSGVGFYLMSLISDELAYFQKIGVTGCAVQASWSVRKTVSANLYVFAKNAWDISLPTEKILSEYARARFSKAAEPMLKYLNAAERNSREFNRYFVKNAEKTAARDKNLAECQKYLDDARLLADTEQAKNNIADEEASFKKLKNWQLQKK